MQSRRGTAISTTALIQLFIAALAVDLDRFENAQRVHLQQEADIDHYFRSLVMTKLTRLRSRILRNYQDTNKMIRELIASIDRELGGAR